MRRLARDLVLLLFALACVNPTQRQPSRDRSVVTHEELDRTRANTIYAALEYTRPSWLSGPRQLKSVFWGGMCYGAPSVLKNIRVAEVSSVQRLDESGTMVLYGSRCPGPSLVLELWGQ